jgi:peptidoglycan/xylan/chitin deacetylase (PgdA/CDA1 family)/glycine betaine/choline ABC-type transport system substrate-binding protein
VTAVRRHALGSSPRRPRPGRITIVAGATLTLIATACTGSPVKLDPPNAPNAVVASADRIREGQARLGGESSCLQSAYCAAGLSRVYGINLGSGGIELETPEAIVEALSAGAIDVGALPSSAVEVADPRITVLTDDRGLQPADNIIPVVAGGLVGTGGPALTAAVDLVSATLDQTGFDAIQQALAGGASPDLAAQAWLQSHPLPFIRHPRPNAPPIIVGDRTDTTSMALSDLYAGALKRAGWVAVVRPVGGDRAAEIDALELGHVGIVPDDEAGLLEQLDGFSGAATGDVQHNTVLLRLQLADRGLAAFEPSPASPGTVFAVNQALASSLSLKTLSDLAHLSGAHEPGLVSPPPLTPGQVLTDTEGPPPLLPPTLGIGSVGLTVAALQAQLNDLGYGHLDVTGTFDEATRRAVGAFQSDQGIVADGQVDAFTAKALAAAHPISRPVDVPAPGDPNSVRVPARTAGGGTSGTVYLVFADGPSSTTPEILCVLEQADAHATFFAEEGGVAQNPDVLPEITAAGDGVGISVWPHDSSSPIAEDVLFRTVTASQEAISELGGRTPTCLLAPYGATDAGSRARASDLGLRTVLWDIDPQDWRHPGASVIADDVISNVHAGSIVLLHDGGGDRSQTLAALETILPTLSSLGYGFASIPGC